MSEYKCNHCKEVVNHNGGSAEEVGMIEIYLTVGPMGRQVPVYYCEDCAKEIAMELLEMI